MTKKKDVTKVRRARGKQPVKSTLVHDEIPLIVREALHGERGEDQKRLAEQGIRLTEELIKKNTDYGGSAWKPPVLVPNLEPKTAILVRMSDKIERIQSLVSRKADPLVNESLDLTILDLSGYGLLWLTAPEEKAAK